jgi:hypothetical protein
MQHVAKKAEALLVLDQVDKALSVASPPSIRNPSSTHRDQAPVRCVAKGGHHIVWCSVMQRAIHDPLRLDGDGWARQGCRQNLPETDVARCDDRMRSGKQRPPHRRQRLGVLVVQRDETLRTGHRLQPKQPQQRQRRIRVRLARDVVLRREHRRNSMQHHATAQTNDFTAPAQHPKVVQKPPCID